MGASDFLLRIGFPWRPMSNSSSSAPRARPPRVVGLGEILWDLLPSGRQMGGAPANVACHAAALGAESFMVSRVGKDNDGLELVRRLTVAGVDCRALQWDDRHPTGTVRVSIDALGQPGFEICGGVAWDFLTGDPESLLWALEADAICFGTLAQRHEVSRGSIRQFLEAAKPGCLRVFDVNLRQDYFNDEILKASLRRSSVVKLNDAELPVLSTRLGLLGDVRSQLKGMVTRYGLRGVALTRGGEGSLLGLDGEWSEHRGYPARVVDTVGAGDAFTAAMILGILAGWPVDAINDAANRIAAHVCECVGGTPPLSQALRELFRR